MRFLLVDDCEVSLELLIGCLRKMKCDDVTVARDGASALKFFKQEHFDIVIADCEMPKLNELQLLIELRRLDAAIPVIIVTAHPNGEKFLAASNAGGARFLRKSFEPTEFREAIINCVSVV